MLCVSERWLSRGTWLAQSVESTTLSLSLSLSLSLFPFIFLKVLFIWQRETERERETVRGGTQAGGVGEGDAGFPLSREPEEDMGLHPRTLGSGPEPKADTRLTEPPRRPCRYLKRKSFLDRGRANTGGGGPTMFWTRVIKNTHLFFLKNKQENPVIIFLNSFSSMLLLFVLFKCSFFICSGNS